MCVSLYFHLSIYTCKSGSGCVYVQLRLLCNLLSQNYHCYLCPNSINMQRGTHSVDEINILHANHHLWFQLQTHTQKMFDTVDMMLHRHQHEWGPVQVLRALIDVTKSIFINTHTHAHAHCLTYKHAQLH